MSVSQQIVMILDGTLAKCRCDIVSIGMTVDNVFMGLWDEMSNCSLHIA